MTCAKIFNLTHEVKFNPYTQATQAILNESSWLIAPFISKIKDNGVRIIRHPIGVLNSLIGIDFWEDPGHEHYRNYIFHYLPGIQQYTLPIDRSLYYWLEWNKLCDSLPTIRIEDIFHAPKLNQRPRSDIKTWPKTPVTLEVKEYASRYYYA